MKFNLSKYFFDSIHDTRIDEILDKTDEKYQEFFNKYNGKLGDKDTYLSYLKESEKLNEDIYKVFIYFSLLKSIDMQNQDLIRRSAEINNRYSDISKVFTPFIDQELALSEATFLAYSEMEEFADYKNYLINKANNLKYSLRTEIVDVLREYLKPMGEFGSMFSQVTNSLEFDFRGQKLTREEVSSYRESQDESERKDAVYSVANVYNNEQLQLMYSHIYAALCKENVADIKVKKFTTVMESSNISEEMDNEVVDTLIDSVVSYYPIFHKYLKVKAKALGKEKLQIWDVLAPIQYEESEIPFVKGFDMLLNVLEDFDTEFRDYANDMLEGERVDVYPAKSKRNGAFAQYAKDIESFVLLNYTNRLSDVFTLAHEFGHAFHGHLSQVQNTYNYNSSLCLAETASIFTETILFDNIYKKLDKEDKNYYLFSRLDDYFSTIFRQIMYTCFERRCHQSFLDGKKLTHDDLNDIWFEESSKLYGDSVVLNKELMGYGWSSIPHIFNSPFYCYSYAFSNLLSLNLYNIYQSEENKEDFVDMFKNILKSGGKLRPSELLAQNGFDISKKEFYTFGLDYIDELIDNIEL